MVVLPHFLWIREKTKMSNRRYTKEFKLEVVGEGGSREGEAVLCIWISALIF